MTTQPEMCRFTAYISEREREAIDAAAEELQTSANYIVRMAIREYPPVAAKLSPGVTNSS